MDTTLWAPALFVEHQNDRRIFFENCSDDQQIRFPGRAAQAPRPPKWEMSYRDV